MSKETLAPQVDAAVSVPAVAPSKADTLLRVVEAVRLDSQKDAKTYLDETEVAFGGE